MCQCNSPWRNRAEQFLHENPSSDLAIVVDFLLQNGHCGANNGVFLDTLVAYFNATLNATHTREYFQHHILIPLKQLGFICSLPYPGAVGGIFIPCNEEEILTLIRQVVSRVESELTNVLDISLTTTHNGAIQNILNCINANQI